MDKAEQTVFLSNGEALYVIDGHVIGRIAGILSVLSVRALWYGYKTLVLPRYPDTAFHEYTKSFGCDSEIIVPEGIDLSKRLCILDGLDDPVVCTKIAGKLVTSYVATPKLYSFATKAGGRFIGGDPSNNIHKINDKTQYATFSKGIVDIPKGKIAAGKEAIAAAVQDQLARYGGRAFVRLSHAAGGQGNCLFELAENQQVPPLDEITALLDSKDGQDWTQPALVEEHLDIVASPAVTFHPDSGFRYDNLQITNQGKYWGSWSPVPQTICDIGQLAAIGNHFASELSKIGFNFSSNTDLGVTSDGRIVGFEINGRMTALSHAIAIGELLLGPWRLWRQRHFAIKSLDHFALKQPLTFEALYTVLDKARLLATKSRPFGAVITIPPFPAKHGGTVAGIQFHGQGQGMAAYEMAESLYENALALVGDPAGNIHDHPLFA